MTRTKALKEPGKGAKQPPTAATPATDLTAHAATLLTSTPSPPPSAAQPSSSSSYSTSTSSLSPTQRNDHDVDASTSFLHPHYAPHPPPPSSSSSASTASSLVSSSSSSSSYPPPPPPPLASSSSALSVEESDIRMFFDGARLGLLDHLAALLDSGHVTSTHIDQAFLIAAEHGHGRLLSLLLPKVSSLLCSTARGDTALHLAAAHGHYELVESLLKVGCPVDDRNADGQSALHCAVEHQQAHVVALLLEKGARVNSVDAQHNSLLHVAAGHGNAPIVLMLLKANAQLSGLNDRDETPLEVSKNSEIVRILLEHNTTAQHMQQQQQHQHQHQHQLALPHSSAMYSAADSTALVSTTSSSSSSSSGPETSPHIVSPPLAVPVSPFRELPSGPSSFLFWTAMGVGKDSYMFQNFGVFPFDRLNDTERIIVLTEVAEAMSGYKTELRCTLLNESALYAVFALMKARIRRELEDGEAQDMELEAESVVWRKRVLEAYQQVYGVDAHTCGLSLDCYKRTVWNTVVNLLARSLFGEAFWEKKRMFLSPNGFERQSLLRHYVVDADYFTCRLPNTASVEIQLTFKKLITMSKTFLCDDTERQTRPPTAGCFCSECIAELEVPLTFKLQFLEEAAAEKRKINSKKGRKGPGSGGGGSAGGASAGSASGAAGSEGASAGSAGSTSLVPVKGGPKGSSSAYPSPYPSSSDPSPLYSSTSAASRARLDELVLTQRKELTNFFSSISVEEKWMLTEMSTQELSEIISGAKEWETLRAALESYAKYAWEEDVLEISDECFPARDTRLLTNHGFLFLHQLEERITQGDALLYACYDKHSRALSYSPGQLYFPTNTPSYLLTFSSEGEDRWDSRAECRQSERDMETDREEECEEEELEVSAGVRSRLSLRVTPSHRMLVHSENASDGEPRPCRSGRPRELAAVQRSPSTFQPTVVRAAALLSPTDASASPLEAEMRSVCPPLQCREPVLRMVAVAEEGYSPASVEAAAAMKEVQSQLGLSRAQWPLFLELLGFWLSECGRQPHSATPLSAVVFAHVKADDQRWLEAALLDFLDRSQLHIPAAAPDTTLLITQPSWVAFFDELADSQTSTWLPHWWLQLSAGELRRVIDGVWRALGASKVRRRPPRSEKAAVFTPHAHVREQLLHALLHCGYSPHASFTRASGAITGYRRHHSRRSSQPASYSVSHYRQLSAEERTQLVPVEAGEDGWFVSWSDPATKAGSAHCWPTVSHRGGITSHPYNRERDGRIFCVTVEHRDHLIVAQRAEEEDGCVVRQSRPLITGNCVTIADDMCEDGKGMSDMLEAMLDAVESMRHQQGLQPGSNGGASSGAYHRDSHHHSSSSHHHHHHHSHHHPPSSSSSSPLSDEEWDKRGRQLLENHVLSEFARKVAAQYLLKKQESRAQQVALELELELLQEEMAVKKGHKPGKAAKKKAAQKKKKQQQQQAAAASSAAAQEHEDEEKEEERDDDDGKEESKLVAPIVQSPSAAAVKEQLEVERRVKESEEAADAERERLRLLQRERDKEREKEKEEERRKDGKAKKKSKASSTVTTLDRMLADTSSSSSAAAAAQGRAAKAASSSSTTPLSASLLVSASSSPSSSSSSSAAKAAKDAKPAASTSSAAGLNYHNPFAMLDDGADANKKQTLTPATAAPAATTPQYTQPQAPSQPLPQPASAASQSQQPLASQQRRKEVVSAPVSRGDGERETTAPLSAPSTDSPSTPSPYSDGLLLALTKDSWAAFLHSHQVGISRQQFPLARQLKPQRTAVFLFNASDRQLHGVYHCTGLVGENLNPTAFSKTKAMAGRQGSGVVYSSMLELKEAYDVDGGRWAVSEAAVKAAFADSGGVKAKAMDARQVKELLSLARSAAATAAAGRRQQTAGGQRAQAQPQQQPLPALPSPTQQRTSTAATGAASVAAKTTTASSAKPAAASAAPLARPNARAGPVKPAASAASAAPSTLPPSVASPMAATSASSTSKASPAPPLAVESTARSAVVKNVWKMRAEQKQSEQPQPPPATTSPTATLAAAASSSSTSPQALLSSPPVPTGSPVASYLGSPAIAAVSGALGPSAGVNGVVNGVAGVGVIINPTITIIPTSLQGSSWQSSAQRAAAGAPSSVQSPTGSVSPSAAQPSWSAVAAARLPALSPPSQQGGSADGSAGSAQSPPSPSSAAARLRDSLSELELEHAAATPEWMHSEAHNTDSQPSSSNFHLANTHAGARVAWPHHGLDNDFASAALANQPSPGFSSQLLTAHPFPPPPPVSSSSRPSSPLSSRPYEFVDVAQSSHQHERLALSEPYQPNAPLSSRTPPISPMRVSSLMLQPSNSFHPPLPPHLHAQSAPQSSMLPPSPSNRSLFAAPGMPPLHPSMLHSQAGLQGVQQSRASPPVGFPSSPLLFPSSSSLSSSASPFLATASPALNGFAACALSPHSVYAPQQAPHPSMFHPSQQQSYHPSFLQQPQQPSHFTTPLPMFDEQQRRQLMGQTMLHFEQPQPPLHPAEHSHLLYAEGEPHRGGGGDVRLDERADAGMYDAAGSFGLHSRSMFHQQATHSSAHTQQLGQQQLHLSHPLPPPHLLHLHQHPPPLQQQQHGSQPSSSPSHYQPLSARAEELDGELELPLHHAQVQAQELQSHSPAPLRPSPLPLSTRHFSPAPSPSSASSSSASKSAFSSSLWGPSSTTSSLSSSASRWSGSVVGSSGGVWAASPSSHSASSLNGLTGDAELGDDSSAHSLQKDPWQSREEQAQPWQSGGARKPSPAIGLSSSSSPSLGSSALLAEFGGKTASGAAPPSSLLSSLSSLPSIPNAYPGSFSSSIWGHSAATSAGQPPSSQAHTATSSSSAIHSTASSASLQPMTQPLHSSSTMPGVYSHLQQHTALNSSTPASGATGASPFALLGRMPPAAAAGSGGGSVYSSAFSSTGGSAGLSESGSGEVADGASLKGGWGEQFSSAAPLKSSAGLWGGGPFTSTQSGGW